MAGAWKTQGSFFLNRHDWRHPLQRGVELYEQLPRHRPRSRGREPARFVACHHLPLSQSVRADRQTWRGYWTLLTNHLTPTGKWLKTLFQLLSTHMPRQTVTITNKLGLHLRASSKLSQMASSFACEIWLERNTKRINAKSVLGVTMLAAGLGTEVTIETTGEQEDEAMASLVKLFHDKFGEDA